MEGAETPRETRGAATADQVARLERRLERERRARRQAEDLLEKKSHELWQQSQAYQMLAENASDVVYRTSADGTMTWVSPTVATLGWDPADLIGTPTRNLVHPDDQPDVDARRQAFFSGAGEPSKITGYLVRVLAKDGTYHWMSNRVTLLTEPDGSPAGLVGGLTLVDDLVDAQSRLRAGEQLLRLTIDAVLDPLVLLQAIRDDAGQVSDFRYVDVNQVTSEYLSLSRDELIGSSLLARSPGVRETGLFDLYAATMQTGEPTIEDDFHYDNEILGVARYYDLRAQPVPGDRLVLTWRDVTERHEAADRLRESATAYRLLAENSTDVVLRVDMDGVIGWASPGVHNMLGRDPDSLIGTTNIDLIHPDHRETIRLDIEAARGRGEDTRFRFPVLRADGSSIWVESAGRQVIDPHSGDSFRVVRLRDIDAEHRTQMELMTTSKRLRSTLDSLIDPHIVLRAVRGPDGSITDFSYVDANPVALTYLGRDREELVGHGVREVFGEGEGPANILEWCSRALRTEEPIALDDVAMISTVKGIPRRFDIRAMAFGGDSVSFTWRDTTARFEAGQRLADSEQYFRLLANNVSDVVLLSRDKVMKWVSPSLTPSLGWVPQDWVGHEITEFTHPDDLGIVGRCRSEVEAGSNRIVRLRFRHQNGSYHWVEVNAAPFTDADGNSGGIMASFRIIDDQIRVERLLQFQVRHDQLTGLLNRDEIMRRLIATLNHEERQGRRTYLAFIDLDNLKSVNDDYGHAAGDELLRVVAARIQHALRDGDMTARVGGDELLIVLQGVRGPDDAVAVMGAVLEKAAGDHVFRDVVLRPRMSVGLTEVTRGEDVEEAVTRADDAMYRAKTAGGNRVELAHGPHSDAR